MPAPACRWQAPSPSRMRPGVDVLVLGNHGLAVAADTVEDAEALLDKVVAAVTRPSAPRRRSTAPRWRSSAPEPPTRPP